jgi:hypothetical protein
VISAIQYIEDMEDEDTYPDYLVRVGPEAVKTQPFTFVYYANRTVAMVDFRTALQYRSRGYFHSEYKPFCKGSVDRLVTPVEDCRLGDIPWWNHHWVSLVCKLVEELVADEDDAFGFVYDLESALRAIDEVMTVEGVECTMDGHGLYTDDAVDKACSLASIQKIVIMVLGVLERHDYTLCLQREFVSRGEDAPSGFENVCAAVVRFHEERMLKSNILTRSRWKSRYQSFQKKDIMLFVKKVSYCAVQELNWKLNWCW